MTFLYELRKHGALFVMALPALILLVLFNYMPMFGVILAFKNYNFYDGILGSPWVGFDNFKYLFKGDAWLITRNTLLYNLVFIVIGLILSVALAIILDEIRSRFLSKTYQTILIMPYFLSWTIVALIFYAFLSADKGIVNQLLSYMGFHPINFYTDMTYWPYILIFVFFWKSVGYNSIIYLASVTGISPDYYEAATIDGANKWQQIRYITLPCLRPIIIIMTILSIGKIFYADFGLFYQVTYNSGALYPVTQVIDTYVYNGLVTMGNYGMTAAAGLYQSFVGFVLVILTNWIVKKVDRDSALF
ncbi:ABC transporter permease [Paenibacillus hunanensis]|uniref:Aldouronate transport system permease protein n=1 Tax=Paenibacillus hunanensis TaxID=539262 RepID=A0ABU1IVV6_9BACL|nr:putative aldouronate transport system permease protein [Paenibacillus hunanensis]GGI96811.1 sugar ABC transporter permease [Paenibacillus hunanensis]